MVNDSVRPPLAVGPMMPYLVFSQSPSSRVDPAAVLAMARRHFQLDLDVLAEETTPLGHRLRLAVTGGTPRRTAEFVIAARARTDADLENARTAEVRGKAGGMSDLAARCPTIWELEGSPEDEPLVLELCALLAAVALGPVLPPDHSTLFGVRGARERAALKR